MILTRALLPHLGITEVVLHEDRKRAALFIRRYYSPIPKRRCVVTVVDTDTDFEEEILNQRGIKAP